MRLLGDKVRILVFDAHNNVSRESWIQHKNEFEARTLSHHPNIFGSHVEFSDDADHLYVIKEFSEAVPLSAYVARLLEGGPGENADFAKKFAHFLKAPQIG